MQKNPNFFEATHKSWKQKANIWQDTINICTIKK